jgi:hypothetical protein
MLKHQKKVKGANLFFLYTSSNIATILIELYKTHVKKAAIFSVNTKVKK